MEGIHFYQVVPDSQFFSDIDQIIEFVKGLPIVESDDGMGLSKDYLLTALENTKKRGLKLKQIIKMERKEVYKRIDDERDYQDMRWNNNLRSDEIPDEDKPVAEWLNYIEYHLDKAKNANYQLNKEESLAELRKVAALAVRAMEIHGCPERKINQPNGCCGNCHCNDKK